MVLATSLRKKGFATETARRRNRNPDESGIDGYGEATVQIPEDDNITYVYSMTLLDQSQIFGSSSRPKR